MLRSSSFNGIEALDVRVMLSAPGDLDGSFGVGGKYVGSPVAPTGDLLPTDLAVQADGKLLYLGIGFNDVAPIVRVNVNGTVDSSFGDNGLARSGYGPYISDGVALAVGPQGKIAAAGFAAPYRNELPEQSTLVVYKSNGALDTSFDGDGILTAPQYPRGFSDVAFQADGKILVIGEKLVRYNTDGKPDPTFSGDGVVDVSGKKVLIDANGKIVVLGYFAIFRFNADGSPDASFDGDGVLPNVKGTDIAFAPDGDILVAGNGPTADLVSRFNYDGRNDVTFGSSGNATVRGGRQLALTAGDIYVGNTVGSADIPFNDFEIRALTQGGQVDATFGNGGRVQTDINGLNDNLVALAIEDGKLVALGSAEVTLDNFSPKVTVPAMVRYQISSAAVQTPFSGSPVALPGLIQAEDFDRGGEGVAYHDTEAANLGGAYRAGEGVDVQKVGNSSALTVGFVKAGEWLEYTVNAASGGVFDVAFAVSSLKAGGTFHLEVDGRDVTGRLTIPQTGDWNSYRTVTKTGVGLSAGQHVLRLAFDTNGPIGYVGNFDDFHLFGGSAAQQPFTGTPIQLPTLLEVENFDTGGEGVAYHDTDAANLGGVYRTAEGVDIQPSFSELEELVVGFVKAGEWLEYTVNVPVGGQFDLKFRVAHLRNGGRFHLESDGTDVTGSLAVPRTGDWDTYTTITKSGVSLSAGPHVLRLAFDAAGDLGYVGNFNWIRFDRTA